MLVFLQPWAGHLKGVEVLVRKVIGMLMEPQGIPEKIARFLERIRLNRLKKDYDFSFYDNEQDRQFAHLGLDRKAGTKSLADLYGEFPELAIMRSEHHVLFASYAKKFSPEFILEIGTFSGAGTRLLSLLFPDSKIISIDLKDEDPIFVSSYSRDSDVKRMEFIKKRNSVLDACENVNFMQMNSLALTYFDEQKFDFIWIDGAHGYPVVTADIINSLRLLKSNGVMLIDDVWDEVGKNDQMYKSIAAYETLSHLASAGLVQFDLVCKRITFPKVLAPYRKYVAVVKALN